MKIMRCQVLKTQDEEKVKAQLLRMIHSLFLQVTFAFLMNIPPSPPMNGWETQYWVNFNKILVCCRKLNGKGGVRFPPSP